MLQRPCRARAALTASGSTRSWIYCLRSAFYCLCCPPLVLEPFAADRVRCRTVLFDLIFERHAALKNLPSLVYGPLIFLPFSLSFFLLFHMRRYSLPGRIQRPGSVALRHLEQGPESRAAAGGCYFRNGKALMAVQNAEFVSNDQQLK
jgi:hypothetical protein